MKKRKAASRPHRAKVKIVQSRFSPDLYRRTMAFIRADRDSGYGRYSINTLIAAAIEKYIEGKKA